MTIADDGYAKLAVVQGNYGNLCTQYDKLDNLYRNSQEDLQIALQRVRDLEHKLRLKQEEIDRANY